ncbi:MAG: hypothetical protein Kow0042_19570 [Calditrichia bacterium]
MKSVLAVLKIWMLCFSAIFAQNYLSNLSAQGTDPLYTTYAAPLSRSEFIIDQGYHLRFYDNTAGVGLVSEEGGEIGLALKLEGEVRYLLSQMHQKPLVAVSYSDVGRYIYEPFADVEVEIFFHVYSSRIAIQQITVHNQRPAPIHLQLYPFFQHPFPLHQVAISGDTTFFSFTHRQDPDGWTLAHGIPYEAVRRNVFLISEPPDAFGSYANLGDVPQPLELRAPNPQNYCVEWGLVHHVDGSLCLHAPPDAQQIILHNGSAAEILTEDAPKWGDPDPNIPGNGYQGCELGNFCNPPVAVGDSFTVIFSCLATAEQGRGEGQIAQLPAPAGIYTEVQLDTASFPPQPQNVAVDFSINFNSAFISWEVVPGLHYSLYRRTASTPGRYDLIADSLVWPGYLDLGLNPDSTYGYVVIAHDSSGRFSPHSPEVGNFAARTFFRDVQETRLYNQLSPFDTRVTAFQKTLNLQSGENRSLRILRGLGEENTDPDSLANVCRVLLNYDLQQAVNVNEQLYQAVPRLNLPDPDQQMMYWSAFNLMRQCMLPPEGQCSYNYYVFSREPQWGWGHGGQVFHESLTMLAYAYLDPLSAMNSQRVYLERQWPDGYINYRTGPYLNETIPYNGQFTTSAPWFNWENWEIFQIAADTAFLGEAYQSGKLFYQYWLNNRDADGDGLCEWGAHAVLECVRDGQVAVWDQVGWPSNFECLDLNCLLVSEAAALAEMAERLGLSNEAQQWRQEAAARSDSINKYMWDAQTGFYYHVDKTDHDFSFNSPNDLKRQEIIGFLPLWAGVADSQQAVQLVQHLTNPDKFWRNFGVPTLAADDPYYSPMGYWNGPVWVQWEYLIFRGLLRYGYSDLAAQLAERMFQNVIYQLKENHWFWELYSPDGHQAGWHKTYIWSGLVARMLIDLYGPAVRVENHSPATLPRKPQLWPNYPNPFNPGTTIEFFLPRPGRVLLRVYDIQGRVVKTLLDAKMGSGQHRCHWDGRNERGERAGSGVYFYQLIGQGRRLSGKMVLLR